MAKTSQVGTSPTLDPKTARRVLQGRRVKPDTTGAEWLQYLLEAAGVKRGTREAVSFLTGLRHAVELYRRRFPDGRPPGVLLPPESPLWADLNFREKARILFPALVAERKTYTKLGNLSKELADHFKALSPGARSYLDLEVGRPAGEIVEDLEAVREACRRLSKAGTRLATMRKPRSHRDDVQFLVDSVVETFLGHYTKLGKGKGRPSNSLRAKGILRTDVTLALQVCFPAAGVDFEIAVEGGDRLWRDYISRSLDLIRKKVFWAKLASEVRGLDTDALLVTHPSKTS